MVLAALPTFIPLFRHSMSESEAKNRPNMLKAQ
jgi:hypothetical protein